MQSFLPLQSLHIFNPAMSDAKSNTDYSEPEYARSQERSKVPYYRPNIEHRLVPEVLYHLREKTWNMSIDKRSLDAGATRKIQQHTAGGTIRAHSQACEVFSIPGGQAFRLTFHKERRSVGYSRLPLYRARLLVDSAAVSLPHLQRDPRPCK